MVPRQERRGQISGTKWCKETRPQARVGGLGGAWEASDGVVGAPSVTAAASEASCCSSLLRQALTTGAPFFLCLHTAPPPGCARYSKSPTSQVRTSTCSRCSSTCSPLAPATGRRSLPSFRLTTPTPSRCVRFSGPNRAGALSGASPGLLGPACAADGLTGLGSSRQGVGTVVSGTTLRGLIKLNDTLLLGPDPLGNFLSIAVKSIHRKRMPVKEVRGGQTASFALKKVSVERAASSLGLCVTLGSDSSPALNSCSARQGVLTSLLQMRKLRLREPE